MNTLLNRFVTLPRSAQIGLMLISCTSVAGFLAVLAFSGAVPWSVVMVIIIGLVLVGLMLALYRFLLIRRKKRKAKPFEKDLADSGGAVPQAVSDVADRARMDEMRKRFEKGVATFKEHGKDLYGLPWYVIIGEPGSGKSEAIRHCGIGFPPGLQDELQGTGGTINMDWWFTNHAVILDTAGRLTFGEVESTDTREWKEFLRLLNKNRPNCPINGLLITIPVDSLIQDDADQLEMKGGRIARQLDLIQRTLGVRFPVFVIVTKADKLLGFRQFFSTLRDPQLQHQMLGWSNPGALDDPFDPGMMDEHLQQVRQRLMRRRLSRLLENGSFDMDLEDSGRRTDQVDELYAFPEAMQRISSRLRRYLELIFVGGEWSSKPLFLRGIYFTSSMQHGEALDAELADALGVPVESLHEALWRDDRAYFLRDMFMEKVFRERGLVTNATNTRARQRKRRTLLLGAGSLASVILIVLIAWAYFDYKSEVDDHVTIWTDAADNFKDPETDQSWVLVKRDPSILPESDPYRPFVYVGNDNVAPDGGTLVQFLERCRDDAMQKMDVPPAFWLPDTLFSRLWGPDERLEATGELFRAVVVQPLFKAARDRFERGPAVDWSSDEAITALAQFIDLQVSRAEPDFRPNDGEPGPFNVADMLAFGIPDDDYERGILLEDSPEDAGNEEDRRKRYRGNIADMIEPLQSVCDWLYRDGNDYQQAGDPEQYMWGKNRWPPAGLADDEDQALILAQLRGFNQHWLAELNTAVGTDAETGGMTVTERAIKTLDELPDGPAGAVDPEAGGGDRSLNDLKSLRLALKCFRVLEDDLLSTAELAKNSWNDKYDRLQSAHEKVSAWLEVLEDATLTKAWEEESTGVRSSVQKHYDLLLAKARGNTEPSIDEIPCPEEDADPSTGAEEEEATEEAPPAELSEIERLLVTGWCQIKDGGGQTDDGDDEGEIREFEHLLLEMKGRDGVAQTRLFQIRFEMYEQADKAMRAAEAGGDGERPRFGDTAARLLTTGDELAAAREEIKRLAVLGGWSETDATDGWQHTAKDRLAACYALTAERAVGGLADQLGKRALADRFLQRLRSEADDGRLAGLTVADIAKLVAGEAGDSDCRVTQIPLTALQSKSEDSSDSATGAAAPLDADGRFCPDVAVGLVKDWKAVRDLAAGADREVVQRRIDEYVSDYLRYWSADGAGTLVGQLLSFDPALDWEEFRKKVVLYDYPDFGDKLPALAKNVEDALNDITEAAGLDQEPDREIDGEPKGETNASRYRTLLRNWKKQEGTASDVRDKLLRVSEGIADYFVSYNPDEPALEFLAKRFWAAFGRNALKLLVEDAKKRAGDSWAELQQPDYKMFPVDPGSDDDLPAEKVRDVQARVGACITESTVEGAADWGSLQPDVKDLLTDLGAPLLTDHGAELEQLSALVDALPGPRRSYTVEVHAVNRRAGDDDFSSEWGSWPILEINNRPYKIRTLLDEVELDGLELRYPGQTIKMTLRRSEAGESVSLTFNGHWSLFRMMRDCNEARPLRDGQDGEPTGRQWLLQFLVKPDDSAKEYSLWLKLVFNDQPLPEEALRGWDSVSEKD
ncbi:MAG: hypothetical protein JSV91_13425 [Phycisphaerales bacterium]|nr:MAG: hypothetical protein JSV91_13425 [Phycisphaerales bacterium]